MHTGCRRMTTKDWADVSGVWGGWGELSYKEAIPDSPRVGVRFQIVQGWGVEARIYCHATLSYSPAPPPHNNTTQITP